MGDTHAGIADIGAVFVPVADQDRALRFFTQDLGFEKRADFVYGGGRHRWIEVAPPGAGNTLALVPPSEGSSAGGDVTRCAFATTDIEAEHARLTARGVEIDRQIGGLGTDRSGLVSDDVSVNDPVPPQFFVSDPDGNRFLIVQPE